MNWKTVLAGLVGVGLSVALMAWIQHQLDPANQAPVPAHTTADNALVPQTSTSVPGSGDNAGDNGADAATLPYDEKPNLLKSSERDRYNVVEFGGRLYALPWGLEVDWAHPPEPTPDNGVFIGTDPTRLEQQIQNRRRALEDTRPRLIRSDAPRRYNLVAFGDKVYALPWGLEVDWSQPPQAGDGVYIAEDIALLEETLAALPTEFPQAQLAGSSERYRYNVVEFGGRLYGLPWGLEVDWARPPAPTPDNGVFIANDRTDLMARIRERVLTDIDWDREGAWIVEAIDDYRYNIVAFENKLYALPWGLEVDWSQPPAPAPGNGVFIGTDAKQLEERIHTHLVETSLETRRPEFLKSMDKEGYELYLFAGKFYAVPVGTRIKWMEERESLPEGVLTAPTPDQLKALITFTRKQ